MDGRDRHMVRQKYSTQKQTENKVWTYKEVKRTTRVRERERLREKKRKKEGLSIVIIF